MPGDSVSFQKNAGYEDGDTDDVFLRQAAESNALLFSLDQPVVGYMVKSMRLIPTNTVGQACDRVRLPRLPREAGFDQERGQSKVENDTVTLNEEQGDILPRRKDTTPNDTWVAFGVRSVVASLGDECGMVSLKTSSHDKCGEQFFLSRPADRGGLATW